MARHGQRIAVVFSEGMNQRRPDDRRVFLEEGVAEPVREARYPVRRAVRGDERESGEPDVRRAVNCTPGTRGEASQRAALMRIPDASRNLREGVVASSSYDASSVSFNRPCSINVIGSQTVDR